MKRLLIVQHSARRWSRAALPALLTGLLCSCGSDEKPRALIPDVGATPLDAGVPQIMVPLDAGGPDVAVGNDFHDASASDANRTPMEAGSGCMLGSAGSFATDQSLDLFGDTVYFAMGQELPAGHYRVTFRDGCMKYNYIFPWTVNSNSGTDGWWLVGESTDDRILVLPGTAGVTPFDGYFDFEACVSANQALDSVEFDFEGGRLGIWLNDAPYDDNQAGEGGRNPAWDLTLLVEECPPDIVVI